MIAKSKEQRQRILKRLQESFMFRNLSDREKDVVVSAMDEKKFKYRWIERRKNAYVIKQGEDGDNLYVVDQGLLDCTKKNIDKVLKSY